MARKFVLSDVEVKQYREWRTEHLKECPVEEVGAIGGRFTFSFTPIGLGTIVVIKCVCGKELDLTDYENW